MRSIVVPVLLVLMLALFSSCNDWLDVLPENDQVADEYWQTKEDVEAVIASIYIKYRATVPQQIIWGELRGNSMWLTGTMPANLMYMRTWNILPENDNCKWDKWYQIINLANMVIAYAPKVAEKDKSFNESLMNSYVAEAHYLRGLAYFFLVRNFREVPLILEPYMNDKQNYEIPKATEEEIWDQIVADLLIAEEGTKSFFSEEWASKGRATKWAVKATLADVYLWTKDYEEAIIKCNEVINSGKVGLISGIINETENNWFNIFAQGNTNEGIFELQWDYEQSQNNTSLFNLFGNTSSNYMISNYLYLQFSKSLGDIRAMNATYTFPEGKVWKYIGSTAGNNTVPTEMGFTRTDQEKDQNWIMYRIADVYLMKAEALVMRGSADDYALATGIVNKIRDRAKVTNMAEPLPAQMDMIDMVLNERMLELAAEGKRWYDLLRVSRINDDYNNYMINEVLKNASPSSALIIQSKLKDRNSHYLPIHSSEIQNNKALIQNPFYETLN